MTSLLSKFDLPSSVWLSRSRTVDVNGRLGHGRGGCRQGLVSLAASVTAG